MKKSQLCGPSSISAYSKDGPHSGPYEDAEEVEDVAVALAVAPVEVGLALGLVDQCDQLREGRRAQRGGSGEQGGVILVPPGRGGEGKGVQDLQPGRLGMAAILGDGPHRRIGRVPEPSRLVGRVIDEPGAFGHGHQTARLQEGTPASEGLGEAEDVGRPLGPDQVDRAGLDAGRGHVGPPRLDEVKESLIGGGPGELVEEGRVEVDGEDLRAQLPRQDERRSAGAAAEVEDDGVGRQGRKAAEGLTGGGVGAGTLAGQVAVQEEEGGFVHRSSLLMVLPAAASRESDTGGEGRVQAHRSRRDRTRARRGLAWRGPARGKLGASSRWGRSRPATRRAGRCEDVRASGWSACWSARSSVRRPTRRRRRGTSMSPRRATTASGCPARPGSCSNR